MSLLIDKHARHAGRIGVVSCGGGLSAAAAAQLAECGWEPTAPTGWAAAPATRLRDTDALKIFNDDPATEAVVIVGEAEDACADWITQHMKKPVLEFVEQADVSNHSVSNHRGIKVAHNAAELAEELQAALGPRWLPFD